MITAIEGPNQSHEPLRMTDSKVLEIVEILRRHFSSIPDFRHMSGIKIRISCTLSFQSKPFNRVWGNSSQENGFSKVDGAPALYATFLKFSSSARFWPIQPRRIQYLLGEPTKNDVPLSESQIDSLDIVHVGNGHEGAEEEEEEEKESFKAPIFIELQPREPTPGLIDVTIEANAENGQIICGHLHSVTVAIEDMFLKALVLDDIHNDDVARYYMELFNALWEACSSSSSTGRETFPLKGGKGVVAVNGTRSVKFLEVPAASVGDFSVLEHFIELYTIQECIRQSLIINTLTPTASLVQAIEKNLSAFVVNVIGDPLINIVKDGGIISDIIWNDDVVSSGLDVAVDPNINEGPLKYDDEEDESGSGLHISKRNMGRFHILIFLPPTS
ncbi:AP-5 complex subunit beta-1 [Tanacetum coccineum]